MKLEQRDAYRIMTRGTADGGRGAYQGPAQVCAVIGAEPTIDAATREKHQQRTEILDTTLANIDLLIADVRILLAQHPPVPVLIGGVTLALTFEVPGAFMVLRGMNVPDTERLLPGLTLALFIILLTCAVRALTARALLRQSRAAIATAVATWMAYVGMVVAIAYIRSRELLGQIPNVGLAEQLAQAAVVVGLTAGPGWLGERILSRIMEAGPAWRRLRDLLHDRRPSAREHDALMHLMNAEDETLAEWQQAFREGLSVYDTAYNQVTGIDVPLRIRRDPSDEGASSGATPASSRSVSAPAGAGPLSPRPTAARPRPEGDVGRITLPAHEAPSAERSAVR